MAIPMLVWRSVGISLMGPEGREQRGIFTSFPCQILFGAYIEELRDNGGDIKIAALQPKVFNVFDLLGFPMLFDILETEQEAIEKFGVAQADD